MCLTIGSPTIGPARGRLAPSPTGRLHLGNAYAFLTAWLSARSQGGALVLRLEDVDPERSKPRFIQVLLDDLRWLGLNWDEGPDLGGPFAPYEQSLRLERYAAVLRQFEARGLLYPCYCTRKELRQLASAPHIGDEGVPYPGTCRSLSRSRRDALEAAGRKPCLRLDVRAALHDLERGAGCCQAAHLGFKDGVLGDDPPGTGLLAAGSLPDLLGASACPGGDFALRRSDGVVAYQLAVVADDLAMAVTEVVRGDDLLSSTPRQILLCRLLGGKPPSYAHLPLLLDAAGERLAKRHRSVQLAELRQFGIRPEAVVGYLGFLAGWLPEMRAAAPGDLVSGFSFGTLRGRPMQLPEDVVGVLQSLSGRKRR